MGILGTRIPNEKLGRKGYELKWVSWVLLSLILLSPGLSQAQIQVESQTDPTSSSQLQIYRSTNDIFENDGSYLGWSFNSYFRSDQNYYRSGAESELTDLDLHLKGKIKPLRLHYNVRDTYRIGENYNYVKPYEFYMVAIDDTLAQLKVGRVLNSWSQSETYWAQGLWQPRFLDDRFVADQGGLTGFFLEKSWGQSKALLWGSPIHVPEIGPDFSVEEEQFVSGSPWFKTPPSTVIIRGQETRVGYRVNKPGIDDVLLNPGAGINWQSEDPDVKRYLSRLSYAYKPIAQILIGFPFFLELSEDADSSSLDVEVQPRFLYHHIATWETENEISDSTVHTSVTYESPKRDSTPANWITQEVGDAFITSVWLEQELGRSTLDLGWLRVWGGDKEDKGDFAPPGTLFERRYQYLHAVRVGLNSGTYSVWGWSVGSSSRFIYDFKQAGLTWVNELVARPVRDLSLHLRADIIGLTGDEEKIRNGFIGTYRANDRLQAGVRYVF